MKKKSKIDKYTDQEALDYHNSGKSGKIEILSSKPMTSKRDLALAYSPGVAIPCQEIEELFILLDIVGLLLSNNDRVVLISCSSIGVGHVST